MTNNKQELSTDKFKHKFKRYINIKALIYAITLL